jgi:hypothetical protein
MLPIDDLAACAVLAAALVGLVRGAFNVAVGGFLFSAFGAMIVAVLLSFVLSAVSSIALQGIAATPALEGQFVFVRAALAGVAQPTVTGVALLASTMVLGYGCAKAHDAVETITILLRSHKQLGEQGRK